MGRYRHAHSHTHPIYFPSTAVDSALPAKSAYDKSNRNGKYRRDSMRIPGNHPDSAPLTITQLIRQWQGGDSGARERLLELTYEQIRMIARCAIRAHRGATLSATELAHEALMRLLGEDPTWADRRHFYNVVAQATRQVLVDSARRRLRDKRGGGIALLSLSAADEVSINEDETLIRVNEAIERLGKRTARCAQVIQLAYFVGLERAEIAATLEISIPTADRDLRFGRAWLKRELQP
ncbi:MAG: sigma-70 family RNA polymerase sigma factor [Xanthomonadales bacterium]|nr:sigma-70 family RNA polymerase sigma factor [Xanthomonadales bacterium]